MKENIGSLSDGIGREKSGGREMGGRYLQCMDTD
jgi:hypothetical protein